MLGTRINEIQGGRNYYLIPLESCENCVYSNLQMLDTLIAPNLSIVLVGVNYHSGWDNLLERLKKKYTVFNDPQKLIYSYESNLGKPLLLAVENGNCMYSRAVNEADLKAISVELEGQ